MSPFHIFLIIFSTIAIFWFTIEIVLFNTCISTDKRVPENIHELCKQEKNLLLLKVFDNVENEPQCMKVLNAFRTSLISQNNLPRIYIITPTYARPVQKAELTRLSYTLMLVPSIHWIVVEDSANKTVLVTNFLKNTHISSSHLNVATPPPLKMASTDPNWLKPRGVLQRNLALSWLRKNLQKTENGVVYFADDDNTYDLALFEEMRYTKTVSVWPVGLVGGLLVERPLVRNGIVTGWNTVWKPNRPFPIDMAGFAINLRLLLKHPEAAFSLSVPRGYQESKLLKNLVSVGQLEPKAANCTKVLVWHTRTEYPKLKQERKLTVPSNLNIEV